MGERARRLRSACSQTVRRAFGETYAFRGLAPAGVGLGTVNTPSGSATVGHGWQRWTTPCNARPSRQRSRLHAWRDSADRVDPRRSRLVTGGWTHRACTVPAALKVSAGNQPAPGGRTPRAVAAGSPQPKELPCPNHSLRGYRPCCRRSQPSTPTWNVSRDGSATSSASSATAAAGSHRRERRRVPGCTVGDPPCQNYPAGPGSACSSPRAASSATSRRSALAISPPMLSRAAYLRSRSAALAVGSPIVVSQGRLDCVVVRG
jgi:hypothetical protein